MKKGTPHVPLFLPRQFNVTTACVCSGQFSLYHELPHHITIFLFASGNITPGISTLPHHHTIQRENQSRRIETGKLVDVL